MNKKMYILPATSVVETEAELLFATSTPLSDNPADNFLDAEVRRRREEEEQLQSDPYNNGGSMPSGSYWE